MFTTLKFSEVKQNTEKKVLGGVFWTRIGLPLNWGLLLKVFYQTKTGVWPRGNHLSWALDILATLVGIRPLFAQNDEAIIVT